MTLLQLDFPDFDNVSIRAGRPEFVAKVPSSHSRRFTRTAFGYCFRMKARAFRSVLKMCSTASSSQSNRFTTGYTKSAIFLPFLHQTIAISQPLDHVISHNVYYFLADITLKILAELKAEVDQFPEINWSDVTRRAIRQIIADLKFLREFKSSSTLTEEDAIELGRKVSEAVAQRLQELE